MSTHQTLMGFDFGFKRIGVATGQTITCSASILDTLPNHPKQTNWDGVDAVVNTWKPDAFVMGLPLNADGSDSDVTKGVRKFANGLTERYKKPIYFQDEHLSSVEAENILQQQRASGKASRKVQKQDIDKLAAAIILQRWLDQNT